MIEFAVRPETAALTRATLAETIKVDRIRLAEAQLLVTEVLANAVVHSQATKFRMEVIEDVTGWRIELTHPSPEALGEGPHGFGFTLLDRLARRWGHRHEAGHLTVWFEVRAAGTGAAIADLEDVETLVRARDDAAMRDEAIRRFAGLAAAMARRFRGKGVADADLEQVAMLGLINAVNRFEPDKGAFEAFATATINGELKRYLRDRAWSVRVPRGLQELTLRVARTSEQMAQALGRNPTPGEIARDLDIAEEEVIEAIAANSAFHWESLVEPDPDTGLILADAIPGEPDLALSADDAVELTRGLEVLPEREREIVRLRFYEDLTQAEIAELLGISQMHVSRLLAKALGRLRTVLE
ncbi:MAG: sigma-70 family RNA polymerase sigma factor [Acidimicrobiia bacterium]